MLLCGPRLKEGPEGGRVRCEHDVDKRQYERYDSLMIDKKMAASVAANEEGTAEELSGGRTLSG